MNSEISCVKIAFPPLTDSSVPILAKRPIDQMLTKNLLVSVALSCSKKLVKADSRFSRMVAFISALTSPLDQKVVFRGPRYIKVKVSSSYFSASSWSSFCMIPSMLRMSSSRLSSFPAQKYGNKFLMLQNNLQTKARSHLFLEF